MITLYNEIVLADGNTIMEGFPERLIKDTKKTLPNEMKSRALPPENRDTMPWIDGSTLGSLPSFKGMRIT